MVFKMPSVSRHGEVFYFCERGTETAARSKSAPERKKATKEDESRLGLPPVY